MQIIHEAGLERIRVNLKDIERLLREQGLPVPDIDTLKIILQRQPSDEDIVYAGYTANEMTSLHMGGLWGPHGVIKLFVDGYSAEKLNTIFLHELHHHIKKGCKPFEWDMPYDERPSEIAANRFADAQAKKYKIVTIPGEMLYALYASKASKFVTLEATIMMCLSVLSYFNM